MSRIHPAATKTNSRRETTLAKADEDHGEQGTAPTTNELMTVWKRSSMSFQGTDGFTVFDQDGRLAFRVDNYSRTKSFGGGGGGGGELVLMDGAGNGLLTLRPQMWSIRSQWNAHRGESYGCRRSGESPAKPRLFSVRRSSLRLIHGSKAEAEVFLREDAAATARTRRGVPDFKINGSFQRRNCCIRSSSGEPVARISRKRVKNSGGVLANDVFSLAIVHGYDAEMIMGIVIVLDRICGKSFGPILCS